MLAIKKMFIHGDEPPLMLHRKKDATLKNIISMNIDFSNRDEIE